DAEVLHVVVGDLVGLAVDDGVQLRVRLERLDRRHREERQERQLDALAGLEVGLGLLPQPRDLGDVDLDDGGELRGDLQRLHHAAGDRLPRARHLLGPAAQRELLLGRRRSVPPCGRGGGRGGRGGGRGLLLPGGLLRGAGRLQDVLLADAAADAGALHRRQVHVVLGGELADQRRDVGGVAGRGLGGRRGRRRRLGRGRLLGLRRGRRRRGRGRLRLGGRGPRGGRRGLLRRLLRRLLPRLGLRGRSLLRGGLLRGGLLSLGGRGLAAGRRLALVPDDRQFGADLDGLVLGDGDAGQDARGGRGDLGVDLVGRHLEERLVGLDALALLFEPAGDGALGDALAELGHGDGDRHVSATPSEYLCGVSAVHVQWFAGEGEVRLADRL